jgi:hypothetical protein
MKTLTMYSRMQTFIVNTCSLILGGFATLWSVFGTKIIEALGIKNEDLWKIHLTVAILYVLLIAIIVIFICFRRQFGVGGIVRVHKDKNYSEIIKQFKKAEYSIEIIVYHGQNLLYFTKTELVDALKRDVDIKFLYAKADSKMLEETWELEGGNKNEDYNASLKIIDKINTDANSKTCWFRCHTYNTEARYALIIVDGKWAWWTPYHPGLDVPETSSFVLFNSGKNSIIQECKKHFRTLWIKLEQEEMEELKKHKGTVDTRQQETTK